jgi:hypothetical protein
MITFYERRPDLTNECKEVLVGFSTDTGIRQLIQKNEHFTLLARRQSV